MKRKEKIGLAVMLLGVIACAVGISVGMYREKAKDRGREAEEQKLQLQKEEIRRTYNTDNQKKIRRKLERKKEEKEYSKSDMLVEYNPFGTNTLSLYVYFESEQAENVSCTIHVEDENIPDYTQRLTEEGSYVTEHEYQVLGLVPDHQNKIIFTFSLPDGSSHQETITYDMGSLMGTEETVLKSQDGASEEELENGLYVILGNDSSGLDFMYYYDNNGVIRGEVPIIGYRSHRILFDDDSMYYSISESADSYFYKYLVDEEKGAYRLTERFALPYSGYVSSVQEIGDNIVADSGEQGVFGEYDSSGELIRSFTMEKESFIYRVYKYNL